LISELSSFLDEKLTKKQKFLVTNNIFSSYYTKTNKLFIKKDGVRPLLPPLFKKVDLVRGI